MRPLGKDPGASLNFELWLNLQQEMQSALERRLRERLEDEPPFLSRYRRAYERGFPSWTGETLSPVQLIDRLAAAEIILLGDFHSLSQSQRTALRLLKRLIRKGLRPALALEMIPSSRQDELDAFASGKMSESRFVKLAAEESFWDFPWQPIQTLLNYARYHRLPMLALNSRARSRKQGLKQRDQHAARILLRHRKEHPDQPLFVLFGDYHLASAHLPAALEEALAAEAGAVSCRRVFQNYEPLYWESLTRGDQSPEILDLEGGDVCILSATPVVKAQSYLYWLALHQTGFPMIGESVAEFSDLHEDLSSEVETAMKRIARFLSIPLLEKGAPRVHWVGENDFARQLAREFDWENEELALIGSVLKRGEDCYLRNRDLAILGELGQNRLAEIAARVLHGRSTAISARPRSLADDFYLRVLQHALIFMGSKIINPLRKSRDMPYLLRELKENEPPSGRWQQRTELLLAYLEAQENFLLHGDLEGFQPSFFSQDGPLHLDLTRAVGRHLGGLLHEALLADDVDRLWIRELWFEPFHLEGAPLRRYLEILERLAPGHRQDRFRRGAERL